MGPRGHGTGHAGIGIVFDICGGAQSSVSKDGKHGHISAAVIGDEHIFPGRMHAQMSWTDPCELATLRSVKSPFDGSIENELTVSSGG